MKKDTSTASLYAFLKGFHLSESLVLIGAINSALKYGSKEFYKQGIEPYVIEWLEINIKTYQNYLTIFIDTGRLARYLLLSGANDYRNKRLDLRDGSFGTALNMTGAIYDTVLEKKLFADQGSRGLFARMSQRQFPLQANHYSIIARGYCLFVQLAAQFKESYSFDEKMSEYYGISAYDFVATGMTLWMKTDGYESDLLVIEIPAMKNVASDHNQQLFLKVSSGTPEQYRRYIRGEIWKVADQMKDTYGAEPFYRMPAVLIDHSMVYRSGAFVIPQPRYFFDRASSGIFYLLADKEQEIGRQTGHKGQNPFRKEFGHIYRKYAGMQLDQGKSNFDFIDMDQDFENKSRLSIPDFGLIKNEICILFEIKTTLLKIEARSYFDPAVLKSEISDGSFKKAVTQLHTFSDQLLNQKIHDQRFHKVKRVIKIIVGYEDIFVLNTLLLPMVEEEYGAIANDLQIASVSDLDIIGTMISLKKDIVKLITDKVSDDEKRYHAFIAAWEKSYSAKNPILTKSFNELMERMMGDITT